MSNMRDAFKKANLITGKDQKRLAHEERLHRSQVGREGVEQEQREHRAELERMRGAESARTRASQQELEAERRDAAERAACLAILETEAKKAVGGRMRFFFALDDGRLPSLEISEQDQRQLIAGGLCIVALTERRAHVYGLLATPLARRVAAVLPERIVHAPRGVVR